MMFARLLAALVVTLGGTSLATAQVGLPGGPGTPPPVPGTVSWTDTYPTVTNAPPGGTTGSVTVLGAYTVNPGYTAVGASLQVEEQSPTGGVQTLHALKMKTGNIGELDANSAIVPAVINLAKGTYTVRIAVTFTGPGLGAGQQQVTTTKTITIA